MMTGSLRRAATAILTITALAQTGCSGGGGGSSTPAKPNILFVIMDDVGIDQMKVFGYGGETPPSTPNIAAIADAGIRFHNTWAMPACTTSRAVFFEARFPFRTNVLGALGPDDLANSMVSPYEMTTPKLLAQQGYQSALFGKFHLALQGHDPAGYAMVHNLGWDFFAGWLDDTGDPSSIDKTAGGVAPDGVTYSCGFVPSAAKGGADSGACYMADGSCHELENEGVVPPGRICRDQGGILDPNQTCQQLRPRYIDFSLYNGHYVSPYDYNFPDGQYLRIPQIDPRARRFRAVVAVDEAIQWINDRPADQPWMATVSFASDHTPLMQPPVDPAQAGNPESSDLNCDDPAAQRVISNLMIENLDKEFGRLLVETGLAERGRDGALVYKPGQTDTMIIVVGDNGSLGGTVKEPFDVSRAKGTAYQTGVWVPLVVAGPLVNSPGRRVTSMVNIADLYALFGEIAGIENVRDRVPRPIDAEPLLPYLKNPKQGSIRKWNYAEVGTNLQANHAINGPCTISETCTQIPVTKSVCEDNNGTWWGKGADPSLGIPPGGYQYCCQVNNHLAEQGTPPEDLYEIAPLTALAIRNDQYKIVENFVKQYRSQSEPCVDEEQVEFFEINEDVPEPLIDRKGDDLLPRGLNPEQQQNYDELSAQLQALMDSQLPCEGDGNVDYVVDQLDLDDWQSYQSYGASSVYDINIDGLTDELDEGLIVKNLGLDCRLP